MKKFKDELFCCNNLFLRAIHTCTNEFSPLILSGYFNFLGTPRNQQVHTVFGCKVANENWFVLYWRLK